MLRLAGKAKSLRQPAPGLDYLRAVSFYRLGQVTSAYEAVKEELRFFPDNKDARRLLEEIGLQVPKISSGTGHPEADDLLRSRRVGRNDRGAEGGGLGIKGAGPPPSESRPQWPGRKWPRGKGR